MSMDGKEAIEGLTKVAVDSGKLIEAGWLGFRIAALQGCGDVQITEMRKAFFVGAQHLFASIMSFLEEGQEATDADMNRMSQIHVELAEFIKEFKEQTFT